mgnify:CR=1 FL=1
MKTKKLLAILLVLSLAMCIFPASAFADSPQLDQTEKATATYYTFKDHNGNFYLVNSETLVSTGSSHTGYIIVIQEVLQRLSSATGNPNFNPNGIDGVFGNGTRLAVVCFQVQYLGANEADGVVGSKTWRQLYTVYTNILGSPNLTYLVQ